MKKRLLAVLLCLCMAATFLPTTALAVDGEELTPWREKYVTVYDSAKTEDSNDYGLVQALANEEVMDSADIYIKPAADFGWPTETTTIEPYRPIVLIGEWTIPSNITLSFGSKNETFTDDTGEHNNPLYSSIHAAESAETAKIILEGKILQTKEYPYVLPLDCDIDLKSGATLEIASDVGAGQNSFSIEKDRTWTVENGATLNVPHLFLCGTLTGTGTIPSAIGVDADYSSSDGPAATNAVLSGTLTLTNYIRVSGNADKNLTNTLTIPVGSTINFVSEVDEVRDSIKTYTEIVLNDYGVLNVNGTLNVKLNLAADVDDGDYNGKDIVHFNGGNGCVMLGANGVLDVTYPCRVGWGRNEAVTVDGTGTVKFHHSPSGIDWIKIPEDGNIDTKAQRDYMYRSMFAEDISNRDNTNPNGSRANIGSNVKIEYDWDCKGNHNWTTFREKDPTCTESGYLEQICPGCMTRKDESYIPPTGHNISTTPGEDGKYHCQNDGCDVALDTAPVKLPTPGNLTWTTLKYSDSDQTYNVPGAFSWTIPEDFTSSHDHMFELKVYKGDPAKVAGEPVWTGENYTREGETYYSDFDFRDFLGSDGQSGTYYFTVQMKSTGSRGDDSDPCYCTASDVATSATWTYTRPSSTLAAPTGLTLNGTTAKWNAITDTANLECYLVDFYYGDNGNATSTETLRHCSGKFVYPEDDLSCTLDPAVEWLLEGKYLYFTVQAASQDITQSNYSSIVLSPAYKYGGGSTPVDPDPVDPNPGGGSSSGGGSSTTTETTTNPDGSTTTKTEDKTTGTVTETTKNTDGSQTVVETKKDGTVTTTETDATGNKTETVANPDGSSVVTVEQKDGTAATVNTDTAGKVEAEVALPKEVVAAAQEGSSAIMLPIPEIQAAAGTEAAPVVTVKTGSDEPVKVLIPTTEVNPGTVAVIVKEDGTEEIVKTSVSTEDGLAVALPDGATVKIVDNSKTFADVPADNWVADAVSFSSARELFSGTSENTFSPNEPMTRAMMVTVLARFDGADTNGGGTWYEKGAQWAADKGISDGSNLGSSVSREQLAVMLWRYAGSPAPTGNLDDFHDAGSVSDYAQDAMRWAVENGIIKGNGSGGLLPQGDATRAQVAQMLKNFISAQ